MVNTQDFKFNGSTLTKYTGPGADVVIPEGVEKVGDSAFSYCRLLTSVVIPEGVTEIGYRTFYVCSGLTSVVLPDSLKYIGESAFDYCRNLSRLAIPEGVQTIRPWAFRNCESLHSVIIPGEATVLESLVFWDNQKMELLSLPKAAFDGGNWKFKSGSAGVAVRDGAKWSFYAYVSKAGENNFTSLVSQGKWNTYDVDLINNGPLFRYKAPAKLLGSLGRLVDPVELNDECRQLHLEYLIKNAKKLIPIAEELRCPAIVEAMKAHGVINDKNKKAIAKLLAASGVPEIAAIEL